MISGGCDEEQTVRHKDYPHDSLWSTVRRNLRTGRFHSSQAQSKIQEIVCKSIGYGTSVDARESGRTKLLCRSIITCFPTSPHKYEQPYPLTCTGCGRCCSPRNFSLFARKLSCVQRIVDAVSESTIVPSRVPLERVSLWPAIVDLSVIMDLAAVADAAAAAPARFTVLNHHTDATS